MREPLHSWQPYFLHHHRIISRTLCLLSRGSLVLSEGVEWMHLPGASHPSDALASVLRSVYDGGISSSAACKHYPSRSAAASMLGCSCLALLPSG